MVWYLHICVRFDSKLHDVYLLYSMVGFILRYYCLYYFLNRKTLKSPRYYWRLFCKELLRAGDSNGWAHSRCSYCILFRPWEYRSFVGWFYGFISTFVSSMAARFGGAVDQHALIFWSCLVGMVAWPWLVHAAEAGCFASASAGPMAVWSGGMAARGGTGSYFCFHYFSTQIWDFTNLS